MHPFALPLLDIQRQGQDQIKFDALAEVLDDGILPHAAALLVVLAGQVNAFFAQFMQGGLVRHRKVPLAHQLPRPLKQFASADLRHI